MQNSYKVDERKEFDYIIVGAGLFGSVFAREMTNVGKKCLVLEKRSVVGGNIRCENIEGINCHIYGPHIFHTDSERIWKYVNSYAKFDPFVFQPVADVDGRLINLPFNMNTFHQLWGVRTPEEARLKILSDSYPPNDTRTIEGFSIATVGKDIYHKLIKGYTEKQWGKPCSKLPAYIIRRLPIRYTYDNNYFDDRYQGIPVRGYNLLIEALLKGIEVRTDVDFMLDRRYWEDLARTIVYTGAIDQYFNYVFGALAYRSLRFETHILDQCNYQGAAVINHPSPEVAYTRVIEHKHFEKVNCKGTVITKEYPMKWFKGDEMYYPLNDKANNCLYDRYRELAWHHPNLIFGGRLGSYKYYNMDQVIAAAVKVAGNEMKKASTEVKA